MSLMNDLCIKNGDAAHVVMKKLFCAAILGEGTDAVERVLTRYNDMRGRLEDEGLTTLEVAARHLGKAGVLVCPACQSENLFGSVSCADCGSSYTNTRSASVNVSHEPATMKGFIMS